MILNKKWNICIVAFILKNDIFIFIHWRYCKLILSKCNESFLGKEEEIYETMSILDEITINLRDHFTIKWSECNLIVGASRLILDFSISFNLSGILQNPQ